MLHRGSGEFKRVLRPPLLRVETCLFPHSLLFCSDRLHGIIIMRVASETNPFVPFVRTYSTGHPINRG